VVTGEPVAALAVADDASDALLVLLVATFVMLSMVLVLAARQTRLFVTLATTIATVALTFGLMSLLGATLTIASIAILPVLAGIAAALATHYQRTGSLPLAAAAAVAIGFTALVASPVPMVRTFGAFVAVGVVLSFLFAVTLGSALLHGEVRGLRLRSRRLRVLDRLAEILRKALAWLGIGWGALVRSSARRPRTALAAAAAVALLGWILAPQSEAVSGLDRLASDDVREVKDLDALWREGGMERGVNVVVTAEDLADPGVLPWMVAYQRKVLSRHGYSEERPCAQAELCPAVALSDLFGQARRRSRAQTRRALDGLPRYFTQGVVSRDRRTANIPFLIRRMPVDDQRDVIADLRRQLDPPAGVHAELAGSTVLAADAADFGSNSRTLALLALAAVFLMLSILGLRRLGAIRARIAGATVSIIPPAIAAGWSALIVALSELNPMSATLGALVVGLSAYGTIVLSDLYRDGRSAGMEAEAAVTRAYDQGKVLIASYAVVIAGFVALGVSDVRMLREFGGIAVIDLVIVLGGAALVLPAALVWAERRKPFRLRRSRAEWAAAARGGYRKARAAAGAPLRRRREAHRQ
jgi:predicted RND superfamily exporter protein